jgi:hypothetical protein
MPGDIPRAGLAPVTPTIPRTRANRDTPALLAPRRRGFGRVAENVRRGDRQAAGGEQLSPCAEGAWGLPGLGPVVGRWHCGRHRPEKWCDTRSHRMSDPVDLHRSVASSGHRPIMAGSLQPPISREHPPGQLATDRAGQIRASQRL